MISSIEFLHAPLNVDYYKEQATCAHEIGRTLLKVGVAAMVLNDRDELLVLRHEARDGDFSQGAIGPSMETSRFVLAEPIRAETPIETWQRSMHEEINLSPADIDTAKLFIARDSFITCGEWSIGQTNNHEDAYYAAISMMIRTAEPDVILRSFHDKGRTEEIIDVGFMPIDDALVCKNVRPGFLEWLSEMTAYLNSSASRDSIVPISSMKLPKTLNDIRFD